MASDIVVNRTLNINKICSIGNKCDVNENDLLEYFGNDSDTAVISLYLEGVADGSRFVPIAREVAAKTGAFSMAANRAGPGSHEPRQYRQ